MTGEAVNGCDCGVYRLSSGFGLQQPGLHGDHQLVYVDQGDVTTGTDDQV